MIDGIYSITFRGITDWGMGMLIFQHGVITGADAGGALYDGKYKDYGDRIATSVVMTVPPGVSLVQGTPPSPTQYEIPFDLTLTKETLSSGIPVLIHLPPGPVNVIFHRLRNLS